MWLCKRFCYCVDAQITKPLKIITATTVTVMVAPIRAVSRKFSRKIPSSEPLSSLFPHITYERPRPTCMSSPRRPSGPNPTPTPSKAQANCKNDVARAYIGPACYPSAVALGFRLTFPHPGGGPSSEARPANSLAAPTFQAPEVTASPTPQSSHVWPLSTSTLRRNSVPSSNLCGHSFPLLLMISSFPRIQVLSEAGHTAAVSCLETFRSSPYPSSSSSSHNINKSSTS
jgi:hypothetical protein